VDNFGDLAGIRDGRGRLRFGCRAALAIRPVAELRQALDADAMPLKDVLRIGVEAERVSRERLFSSFEQLVADELLDDDETDEAAEYGDRF